MNIIQQLRGKDDQVPDWASFFPEEDFRVFMAALRQDLAARSLAHEVDAGAGSVRITPPGNEPQTFGLLNLAQVCHQTPRGEWPDVIERHLDVALSVFAGGMDFVDRLGSDFSRARPLLKLRLYAEDYLESGIPMVYRPVAEGLVAVLVYDLPQSIASVPADHLRSWRRTEDELFALGLQNVKAAGTLQHSTVPLPQGGALELLTGTDNYFAASHLLCLGDYLAETPAAGALVGAPNRHGLVLHRIEGIEIMGALQALLSAVPGMYAEGPGSISPNLYWWRDGTLTLLPSLIEEGQINFSPPAEFMEMLNGLSDDE
jgi:hypothetical protein